MGRCWKGVTRGENVCQQGEYLEPNSDYEGVSGGTRGISNAFNVNRRCKQHYRTVICTGNQSTGDRCIADEKRVGARLERERLKTGVE